MTTRLDPTGPEPATLRVRSPGDLVRVVPYLLGFHPAESLVLVGMCEGRVTVTARIDLDDMVDPAGAAMLDETLAAMHRGGTREVVGAVFDDRATPVAGLPWRGLADRLDDAARALGIAVSEALLVTAGRYWSYTCADPRCCPPGGRAVESAASSVAAQATYAGLVALPSRAALAAQLDPLPDSERDRLLPAIEAAEHAAVQAALDGHSARHDRSAKRAVLAAARAADAAPTAPVCSDDDLARFGVALSTDRAHDVVWREVDSERLDGRPLWRQLACALPDPYAAAPLLLYGWASWRDGNGALARIAAERALRSDPQYYPADLLTAVLSHGVDPRRMPRLRLGRSA